MGMVNFLITPVLIEEALSIPEGHSIVGAVWDDGSGSIKIYVEGPDLPEIKPGQRSRTITPAVHVETDNSGAVIKKVFSWNL